LIINYIFLFFCQFVWFIIFFQENIIITFIIIQENIIITFIIIQENIIITSWYLTESIIIYNYKKYNIITSWYLTESIIVLYIQNYNIYLLILLSICVIHNDRIPRKYILLYLFIIPRNIYYYFFCQFVLFIMIVFQEI